MDYLSGSVFGKSDFTSGFMYTVHKLPRLTCVRFTSLIAAILEECSFDFGYCGWISFGENDKWKLSLNNTFIKYPGINESIYLYSACVCGNVYSGCGA